MYTKKLAVLAAISALMLVAAVGAGAASAATYLHGGGATTGNVLTSGTTVGGNLTSATYSVSSLGGFSCTTGSIGATVGTSGGATVSGTLDAFSLGNCTGGTGGLLLDSCSQVGAHAPVVFTASGAAGGTMTMSNVLIFCHRPGTGTPGIGCYFKAAALNGTYTNNGATLSISGASLANASQPSPVPPGGGQGLGSLCGAAGSFSAQFAGFHSTSGAFPGALVINNVA